MGQAAAPAPTPTTAQLAPVPASRFKAVISPSIAARLTALPQQAASLRPATVAPLSVIPAWCSSIPAIDGIPQGPGANQVAVLAYPMVKFTDEQIHSLLNSIYGNGGGGDGLIAGTARALAQGIVTKAPKFVASGWVPDPTAVATSTRGTLWLAFGWDVAVTAQNFVKYCAAVITAASGVDPTAGVGGRFDTSANSKPIAPAAIPKVAVGTSDADLQNAAIASASATLMGLTILAYILTGGAGTSLGTINAMPPAATRITSQAAVVRATVLAGPQLAAALTAIPAVAEQIAAAHPDTCQAAVAQADQLKAALVHARETISSGLLAARPLLDAAQIESQPGGGSISDDIRSQIQAAADRSVTNPATNYLIARQSLQCQYYRAAQQTLQGSLAAVASAIAGATADAQTILAEADQLRASIAAVPAAIQTLEAAKQQSCLAWYQKNLYGMPVMYWMAGGTAVLLGGALVLRSRRHARAAKAKASVKPPTPNRRAKRRRAR